MLGNFVLLHQATDKVQPLRVRIKQSQKNVLNCEIFSDKRVFKKQISPKYIKGSDSTQ